jgi:hypothetical protein
MNIFANATWKLRLFVAGLRHHSWPPTKDELLAWAKAMEAEPVIRLLIEDGVLPSTPASHTASRPVAVTRAAVHMEHTLALTRDGVYIVTADEEAPATVNPVS